MNTRSDRLRNERGLTLVEIIIAAGLAVGVALVLAQVMVSSNKQDANLKQKQQVYEYLQQQKYENKMVSPPTPGP